MGDGYDWVQIEVLEIRSEQVNGATLSTNIQWNTDLPANENDNGNGKNDIGSDKTADKKTDHKK